MNTKVSKRALAARQAIDVNKLKKSVTLLSTDHDGEQLAAVAAIQRVLAVAGLGFGDLAKAVETGLMPRRTKAVTNWSPPEPDSDSWESLAWWCHFHRQHLLREEDRGYVAEVLLGDPRHFDCGRVPRQMDGPPPRPCLENQGRASRGCRSVVTPVYRPAAA